MATTYVENDCPAVVYKRHPLNLCGNLMYGVATIDCRHMMLVERSLLSTPPPRAQLGPSEHIMFQSKTKEIQEQLRHNPSGPLQFYMSFKGMASALQMVDGIRRWTNGDLTGLVGVRDAVATQGDTVVEVMHQLALKLRTHCKEADAALAAGILDVLVPLFTLPDSVINAQRNIHAIASALIDYFEACDVKKLLEYMYTTQLSCSIVMELCRFRRGCVAFAQHRLLQCVLLSPRVLALLIPAAAAVAFKCGVGITGTPQEAYYWFTRLMQAQLDALGRCLNGLPSHGALRRQTADAVLRWLRNMPTSVSAFEERLSQPAISRCGRPDGGRVEKHMMETTFACMGRDAAPPLVETMSRLKALAEACSIGREEVTWKSRYMMEPKRDHRLSPEVIMLSTKRCSWCGSLGQTSRCGRCHSNYYCSKECQKEDWKAGHKDECRSIEIDKTIDEIREARRAARRGSSHRQPQSRIHPEHDHDHQQQQQQQQESRAGDDGDEGRDDAHVQPVAAGGPATAPDGGESRRSSAAVEAAKRKQKKRASSKKKKTKRKEGENVLANQDNGGGQAEGLAMLLEQVVLTKEDEATHSGSGIEEEAMCAICLDAFTADEPEETDAAFASSGCTHGFHGPCLQAWKVACEGKGWGYSCPTCRAPSQS